MKKYLLLFLSLLLVSQVALSKNFYRYKDRDGRLIVKDYLPSEAVMVGYEVINEEGRVLERVPAALTAEEKEAELIKQQQLEALQKKQVEERRRDILLMRQYKTIEDIQRTEKNQTAALRANIDLLDSHNSSLTKKLEELQGRAANFERQGKAVPKNTLKEIEATKSQIKTNKASIVRYENKIKAIEEQFQNDLIRFKELQALQLIERNRTNGNSVSNSSVYSCPDKPACDKAWKFAQIFAHENASNKLEIVTDTLIVTGKAQNENQVSLSITRIPGEADNMQIVMEVGCHTSEAGAKLCSSQEVINLKNQFIDYLTERESL
ncbi:hypothetical protein [Kangiella koreensis]|uniref:DUF4124 domain-containing protein n=1 Tax=Kangiella koreensis (strain DSM 16069 / JCM 12317 / KCTC 12182 / SW-125) TaxID=523791 RepID=C7R7U4_KANKD|nr:hypothetical protein [Kangiella koreensis]ACV27627.1 hypothetical protein Kkor_2218 [Kangiella koreensis DSM 16069]